MDNSYDYLMFRLYREKRTGRVVEVLWVDNYPPDPPQAKVRCIEASSLHHWRESHIRVDRLLSNLYERKLTPLEETQVKLNAAKAKANS